MSWVKLLTGIYICTLSTIWKLYVQEGPTTISPTEPIATGPAPGLCCCCISITHSWKCELFSWQKRTQLTWASTTTSLLSMCILSCLKWGRTVTPTSALWQKDLLALLGSTVPGALGQSHKIPSKWCLLELRNVGGSRWTPLGLVQGRQKGSL